MDTIDRQRALQARLVWPCRAIRLIAVAYASWLLVRILGMWSDPEFVAKAYAGWYGGEAALSDAMRRTVGFGMSLSIWLLVVAGVWWTWRLTAAYLAGRVFSIDAAVALKRIGQIGTGTVLLDIALRPAVRALLSPGPMLDAHFLTRWVRPDDLLYLGVFGALLVLAYILESAASLADDMERFV
jgi:hypothetical protein